MADLAASNVTYTVTKQKKLEDGRRIVHATLAFGDGALLYPALGIPVTKGKLACPVSIDSLQIVGQAVGGFLFDYDVVNAKLRMIQSAGTPAHTHDLLLKDAAVVDGATTRVNAGANLLGANTSADITVVGGGANGGVKLSTVGSAAKLVELGNVAVAAQTLKVIVIGY